MTKQHRKIAKQFLIEERRRQVAIMIAQSYTEVEIAAKLGVDNSNISTDFKALKLISQQFIYDITKSDFTYYYKQRLDTVRLVLRRQWEIVDKERITKEDMHRAKVLVDIMNTVSTINGYYSAAPEPYRSPMRVALEVDNFGIRSGKRVHKMIPEEEEQLLKGWEQDDAAEEAELKALKAGDKSNAPEYIVDVLLSKQPDKVAHDWEQSTMEAEQCIERLTK